MNSRKIAPSTGRFPPVPTPRHATKEATAVKLVPPPAAVPKTDVTNRVKLNANVLPIKSAPSPQKEAPTISPTYNARVKNVWY
jgi:hypothetical protein